MSVVDLMPGETPLERTKQALRQAALWVAFRSDLDPVTLYDVRGSTEESYWRHVWIYLVRVSLNIPEADIEWALTNVLVDCGMRTARALESAPKQSDEEGDKAFALRVAAWKSRGPEDKPVHHDTIANACHHIEDLLSDDAAALRLEQMGDQLVEAFNDQREFRATLEKARARLKEGRRRARARL